VDQELKNYLEALEMRLGDRIEKSQSALEMRLAERVEKSESALEMRLAERIEKSENNLLRAFHGWSRSMEIRVRGVSGITVGFEERLSLIEERISDVERRHAS